MGLLNGAIEGAPATEYLMLAPRQGGRLSRWATPSVRNLAPFTRRCFRRAAVSVTIILAKQMPSGRHYLPTFLQAPHSVVLCVRQGVRMRVP
jgi:hypothetical protein